MRRLFIGIWLVTGALVGVAAVITVQRSTEPSRQSVELSSGSSTAPVPSSSPSTTVGPTTTVPQPLPPTTVAVPPTVAHADQAPSAPPTGDATPPPAITFPTSVPGPDEITWEEAAQLIRECQVTSISQTHARNVTLQLKDGTRRTTVEPALDVVMSLSPPQCGTVAVGTE